jgi:GT2 family glycosyltransferase
MKIGFVMTNYNNATLTLKAIESINRFENNLIKIIVVDNQSNDNDINKLKDIEKKSSNVEIIFSDVNLGYFKGLNLGIKKLRMENYEYIVVGNNDVLFPEDFIQSIEKKINLFERYPVVSPNIITIDGFHQNPHVINKISSFRELMYDFYHINYTLSKIITKIARLTKSFTDRKDETFHEVAQEIYQGYGALYILGPKFFENFDELFSPTFLMYEEFFLSKQLSEKGYKIFYEPSIKITHLMHATTNELPAKTKWKLSREAHNVYRKYVKIL